MNEFVAVVRKTFSQFSRDKCLRSAAALSYYTIFSLPPLLVLIVSVLNLTGIVDPAQVRGELQSEVGGVVGEEGGEQVAVMIDSAQKQRGGRMGTLIGAALLVFSATGVMLQLQAALNEAWNIQPDAGGVKSFFLKRLVSLGMILAIAFLLLVSLAASAVIIAVGDRVQEWIPWGLGAASLEAVHWGASYCVFTLLFAALYRFLPDRRIAWRDVWLGAAVTAFLFVLAKFGLGIYLGHSNPASAYGGAASLALILLWIYYSAVIFLLGAEFTQVWWQRNEQRFPPAQASSTLATRG